MGGGAAGVIVKTYYNEMSGQFEYVVRVPHCPGHMPTWGEDIVIASQSANAVALNDMVIAVSEQGERHMGQVMGEQGDMLIVRFADRDGLYLVHMTRVAMVMPFSLLRQYAARIAA